MRDDPVVDYSRWDGLSSAPALHAQPLLNGLAVDGGAQFRHDAAWVFAGGLVDDGGGEDPGGAARVRTQGDRLLSLRSGGEGEEK